MITQAERVALPEAEASPAVPVTSADHSSTSSSGKKQHRLIGIDVSRGLALLGMIAVHALFPFDEDLNPNWVTFIATGNASAVFAVLAGVGLSLTSGRAKVPRSKALTTAANVAGRAVAIGLVGLLLGYTDATIAGVILTYYAVMFLLAIPLLFLRTRVLVLVCIVAAVAVPMLSALVRPALPAPTLANPSFIILFDHPLDLLSELLLTGAYPALPWASYICAGLIVGRLTLSSVAVARRMLIFGAVLGVAAATASSYLLGPLGGRAALRLAAPGPLNADGDTVDDLLVFGFDGTTPTGTWWWLATSAPHAATPLDLLHTLGIAVAVLGAMLLLGHVTAPTLQRVVHVLTAPLAAAGSMSLTLFTAHVVFMNSPLDQFDPMGGYLFQVAAFLLFALGWRQAVGRGPLETAVTAVGTWAGSKAAQGAGKERASSKVPAPNLATPEQAWSWWGEGDGSSAHSFQVSRPGAPRPAVSPARRWPRSKAPDQEMWSWWPDGEALSKAPDQEMWSWWPDGEALSKTPDQDMWPWWPDGEARLKTPDQHVRPWWPDGGPPLKATDQETSSWWPDASTGPSSGSRPVADTQSGSQSSARNSKLSTLQKVLK